MTDREQWIRGRLLDIQSTLTEMAIDPHRPRHRQIPNAQIISTLYKERGRLRLELLAILADLQKGNDDAKTN